MRRLCLVLASVLALAGSRLSAQEVRRLNLNGVAHVDAHDLLKNLSTKKSRCRSILIEPFCLVSHSPTFEDKHYFDQTEFERDVLRIRLYYWKHGYRETGVDTSVTRTGKDQVAVTFNVHEGPPTVIRTLDILADSSLINARTRNRLMLLKPKDALDLYMLDSMRTLYQGELWDRGYGDAVVDTSVTVDTASRLADVSIKLTPNRLTTVGKILITGAVRVNPVVIRNAITFNTGDLYRQSAILESQRNLYESNLFRLAAIDVPPQPDTVKNVNIDVTEAPFHEARFGPGFDNVDFLQLQAHYSSYSLFGGARRLDVDGTVGNLLARSLQGRGLFRDVSKDVPDSNVSPYLAPTYSASVDFKQASFILPSDAASLGAFAHRSINPGVFIDNGYGGTATYTHQLAVRAPLSLNYRYELNRVQASDVYFCVNFGVCDNATITTLRSHLSLSPLTLTGFVDRSDLPFAPTKGYVARLDIEHASGLTASDYRYNRIFFDAAAYTHKSRTKDVLAAHLKLGWVRALSSGPDSGVLHPRKRFYAGGANSVRGYGENQLGPRVLTIDANALDTASGINGGKCARTAEGVKFCDPNSPTINRGAFIPQALGGSTLLEGSVEYHFPIPLGPNFVNWVAAFFVDGGIVGRGQIRGVQTIGSIVKGTGAITPGFGVRYESYVGPIRIDFGINPNRAEDLSVVTAVRDSLGVVHIVPLSRTKNFAQASSLLNRLTLHFSIGEPY